MGNMLGKHFSKWHFGILFFSPENWFWLFLQIISSGDNFLEMSNPVFWVKMRKLSSFCCLLNFPQEWCNMMGKTFSRWILEFFFFFFSENWVWHFLLIASSGDSLQEMSDYFLGKIRKISSICCLLNLPQEWERLNKKFPSCYREKISCWRNWAKWGYPIACTPFQCVSGCLATGWP